MLRNKQSGISLVIIAVLLVVIGVAAGVMITRKEREAVWNPKTGSQTNIIKLKEALVAFERSKHRLPCVAPRNVLPGAAEYGEELSNCSGGAAATGGTVRLDLGGGVYMRIGAVPTKTLGLPEVASEDEWKNRILYAVTESLTDPYQFTNGSGILTVHDGSDSPITVTAAFVVASHGADGKGAYGAKGASVGKVCASTAGKDQANCNDNDAIFVDTSMETTAGANFYDDLVVWDLVDAPAQAMNRPCSLTMTGNANWAPGCTNNAWSSMLSGTGGQAVSNTNTGTHVGNATLACDNGALVYSGDSCFRHCIASSQAWNTDCSGNVPLVNHTTTSGTVSNINPGFTGDATFSCSDGTLSVSTSSCAPVAAGDCSAQAVAWGGGNCSATAPGITNGNNAIVTNTTTHYTGSVTVTCAAGVLSQSGASCAPRAPLCYDLTDPFDNPCGTYTYDNGSIETDFAPCDATLMVPPAGWSFCSAPPSDPCFDNGYGSGCLLTGSNYGSGCIGTDIFSNGTVCCSGCSLPCDNDPNNGLTPGAQYCSGVAYYTGMSDKIRLGSSIVYFAPGGAGGCPNECGPGGVNMSITEENSGCSFMAPHSAGSFNPGFDTMITVDCNDTLTCTCN
jgi:hypothetical protein